MWPFLSKILGGDKLSREDEQLIDQLVDIASSHIRMVGNYTSRLAPLVEQAFLAVNSLEEKLPAPLPLTPEGWRSTPLINMAFANPERMSELVSQSQSVCTWFARHPEADSAFALLAVAHDVGLRYGMEEQNGVIHQDVLQEVLVLRDHRFGTPVASAGDLGQQARLRAMEELAHHAARRIQGLDADRKQLEGEINTLRIALRLGGSTDPIDASSMQRQRMKRLDFLTQELADTRKALEPEALLGVLASTLRDPRNQLRFTETHLCVDALGVIHPNDPKLQHIDLFEIEVIDAEPVRRALIPVEIPRTLVRLPSAEASEPLF